MIISILLSLLSLLTFYQLLTILFLFLTFIFKYFEAALDVQYMWDMILTVQVSTAFLSYVIVPTRELTLKGISHCREDLSRGRPYCPWWRYIQCVLCRQCTASSMGTASNMGTASSFCTWNWKNFEMIFFVYMACPYELTPVRGYMQVCIINGRPCWQQVFMLSCHASSHVQQAWLLYYKIIRLWHVVYIQREASRETYIYITFYAIVWKCSRRPHQDVP